MNTSESQLKMHYGACPKKLEARFQTIIKTYKEHYNINHIPKDKQYWSICGRCSYQMNQLEPYCEPDQLVKEKLITPQQFFGVEICEEIFNFNNSNKDFNWFLGDFYETIVEYANNNEFKPAIVNVDMLLMPKFGVEYLSRIMHFLDSIKETNIMLIGNFIMKSRHQVAKKEDIMNGLQKEAMFQDAMSNGNWNIHNDFYLYNGTGKTRTKMGTVILFKAKEKVIK